MKTMCDKRAGSAAGRGPARGAGIGTTVPACLAAAFLALSIAGSPAAAAGKHGIAMHGAPRYAADFRHLDYVNPDAPKGGELRLAVIGTFDNLNPFMVKGAKAHGRHLMFESLMKRSWDEPFSLYGLIAESVEMPDDRSSIAFRLRPEARFHDGSPVTADDVVFSWETLKEKGRPNHRLYYRKVKRLERPDDRTVRFVFDAGAPDRELPLIIGLMPVLSKAHFSTAPFDRTTLKPPLGTGPYTVETLDAGRSITYRRNPDYWGRHLPVNRGQYNFDRIRYDYYRDDSVMMEAFRAGLYDLRREYSATRWATAYRFPAAKGGRVKLEVVPHGRPSGMLALAFNTRRKIFADRTVRFALAHALDFTWINKTLLRNAYARTRSIFDNSELASRGVPAGGELDLLKPHRQRLPPELFERPYAPPGDGGRARANLKTARDLLAGAGWSVSDGKLRRGSDGLPMAFEILLVDPEKKKLSLAFARNLKRLGIDAEVRTVDSSQYQNRLTAYDFDMIIYRWGMSLSPGNEQAFYWGSAAADVEGTRNYPGIREPVVDGLIDLMTKARGREAFANTVRAMDRVLLWGHYFIPLYHAKTDRIAYWNRFGRPEVTPLYGTVLETWWEEKRRAGADAR